MRSPWPNGFPPVFVHAAWDPYATEADVAILPDHPGYWKAKKRRDYDAALAICDQLATEETLNAIYDATVDGSSDTPIVVAPALSLHETQNVLAIGYAQWLANEMRWDVGKGIRVQKSVNRDFSTDGWFRLVHQPTFDGPVLAGRRYVIADDVCTMGGTIASLRGYIEAHGGRVICATAIANRNGSHARIRLDDATLYGLTSVHGGGIAIVCERELGYAVACLTEAEGRFVLRCPSVDVFREGVAGARDC